LIELVLCHTTPSSVREKIAESSIKEAKDVLGGQEEVLDQFRMTVHARRMEDDQHKTYCSLPLGVYARDQETGRKTFYREQVRACTNPPSIAPALHAAANERCVARRQ